MKRIQVLSLIAVVVTIFVALLYWRTITHSVLTNSRSDKISTDAQPVVQVVSSATADLNPDPSRDGHSQQVPVVIVDHWHYSRDEPFDAVAILRNQSDEYIGNIKVRIRLYDADILYYQNDNLIPDKQVLAPNEETVLFVGDLQEHSTAEHDAMPSAVKMDIAQYQVVSKTDYPYVEPPMFVYNATQYRDDWIGGMVNWIELKNPGPYIYKASEGDPNGTGPIGAHYPYLLGAVLFKDGKIVSAERPLSVPRGNQSPGDSTYAKIAPEKANYGKDKFDTYRLFVAAERLPEDIYPTHLVVDSMKWSKVTVRPCGRYSECPGIQMDAVVRNATDIESETYIALLLRDASSAPVRQFMCSRSDNSTSLKGTVTIPPHESFHCTWVLSEISLGDYPPPDLGIKRHKSKVDDIEYISVHVNSVTTTSNKEFAVPARTTVSCYRASDWAPPEPIVPVARVFLPSAYQAARHLCDTIVP